MKPTHIRDMTLGTGPCIPRRPQYAYFIIIYLTAVKLENFQSKFFDFFLTFAQNMDCGYTLEPHSQGGSKQYLLFMF